MPAAGKVHPMISNNYVIEVDGDAAGLALAERGGWRFAAAATPYWPLDGLRFRDVRQAERAARELRRTAKNAA